MTEKKNLAFKDLLASNFFTDIFLSISRKKVLFKFIYT